jgi:hypothetical protein
MKFEGEIDDIKITSREVKDGWEITESFEAKRCKKNE